MRTQDEVEEMQGRAMMLSESEWGEAVNAALAWVLGDDDDPLAEAAEECRAAAAEFGSDEPWRG